MIKVKGREQAHPRDERSRLGGKIPVSFVAMCRLRPQRPVGAGLLRGCGLLALLLSAAGVYAADAMVVGVYEKCRYTNVTVFIKDGAVTGTDARAVAVEAEIAASRSRNFNGATAAAVSVLNRYGIKDIKVDRRGEEGCNIQTTGRYVEAIGHYCDGSLVRAEISVDGKVIAEQKDIKISLDEYVERESVKLKKQGIADQPRVVVQDDANCPPAPPATTKP